jgi:hypothetical protein
LSALYEAAEAQAAGQAEAVERAVRSAPALSSEKLADIKKRIRMLQDRAGYTSDYDSWIANVTPADLE